MKFTAAIASSILLSGSTLAAPTTTNRSWPFIITSMGSPTPVHYGRLTAANMGFTINGSNQGAQCDKENDSATFQLQGSQLFLYSANNEVQQVFVDRSGMGGGAIGYFDNTKSAPGSHFELDGWSINHKDQLVFGNSKLAACPPYEEGGVWTVRVISTENQAESKSCIHFDARVTPQDNPSSCIYS
ncbi:uncharacterized protein UV8b_06554 [Ustilaginoidea virens]|uniref:Uncharacterized protein n=1 Tax=Ustilaginoidea virens TaxID=1159556 RepID=A0A063C6A0_USTVR|nr:uncharacterized protein UV8b_06554 [Ustilaginoidea virens]QUC22313.1 hypothetical protein UV8b_06554 [Ustilaginoidea virens]GAO14150.1 hypothetical protein UVI_02037650 [Ustilaginoidea virens]